MAVGYTLEAQSVPLVTIRYKLTANAEPERLDTVRYLSKMVYQLGLVGALQSRVGQLAIFNRSSRMS
jgi:hypothetical protein